MSAYSKRESGDPSPMPPDPALAATIFAAVGQMVAKFPRAQKEALLVELIQDLLVEDDEESEVPICNAKGTVLGHFVPAKVGFVTRKQLSVAEKLKQTLAKGAKTIPAKEVQARLKVAKPGR